MNNKTSDKKKIENEKIEKNKEKIKKFLNSKSIINVNFKMPNHLPEDLLNDKYKILFTCSKNNQESLRPIFRKYVNANYGEYIEINNKPLSYYERNKQYFDSLKCTEGNNEYLEFISLINQIKEFIKKFKKTEIDDIIKIISNPKKKSEKNLEVLIREKLNATVTQNPSINDIIVLIDNEKKDIIEKILKFIFSKSKREFHEAEMDNPKYFNRKDFKKNELLAYLDLFKIVNKAKKEKENENDSSQILDSIADMIRSVEKPPATTAVPEDPSQILDSIADMIRSVETEPAPETEPEDPSRLLDSIADMIRSVEKTPEPETQPENPSQLLDSIADMIRSVEKTLEPPAVPEDPSQILDSIADMIRSVEPKPEPPAVPVPVTAPAIKKSLAQIVQTQIVPATENPSQILDSIADMIRSVEPVKTTTATAQPVIATAQPVIATAQPSVQPVIASVQPEKASVQPEKAPKIEQKDQELTNDNILIIETDKSSKPQPINKHGYTIIDDIIKETQYIPPIPVK